MYRFVKASAWHMKRRSDAFRRDRLHKVSAVQETIKQIMQTARDARAAGQFRDAQTTYRRAADLARSTGDYWLLAHALRHVSELAGENGELHDALAAGSEAVALYREHPTAERLDLANALRVTALALEGLASPQEAIGCWHEARALYLEIGIQDGVAECDDHLAGAA